MSASETSYPYLRAAATKSSPSMEPSAASSPHNQLAAMAMLSGGIYPLNFWQPPHNPQHSQFTNFDSFSYNHSFEEADLNSTSSPIHQQQNNSNPDSHFTNPSYWNRKFNAYASKFQQGPVSPSDYFSSAAAATANSTSSYMTSQSITETSSEAPHALLNTFEGSGNTTTTGSSNDQNQSDHSETSQVDEPQPPTASPPPNAYSNFLPSDFQNGYSASLDDSDRATQPKRF
ncbi:hypothetical protein Ciccas_011953, partial [Cichlidogyrus casuarinus]